jgi:membrane protein YqaA with SNARE-associated domain
MKSEAVVNPASKKVDEDKKAAILILKQVASLIEQWFGWCLQCYFLRKCREQASIGQHKDQHKQRKRLQSLLE